MQKMISILLLTTLLALTTFRVTPPLVLTASAATPAYTETNGILNGAHYTVRIPSPIENWNRILWLYCRGYSHDKPSGPLINAATGTSSWANGTVALGCAFAITDYGAGGFCERQGMNATYELTQYLLSNYNIAKVYLVGVSMGGHIALLLGEKYPKVYSGVLDISGSKILAEQYREASLVASTTNDADLIAHIQSMNGVIPPFPFSMSPPPLANQLQAYRNFCGNASADIVTELGGTPETKPVAYADSDPLNHADLSIPVITVHGTSDVIVPYSQSLRYRAAIASAGKSNLYRLYTVVGGQHADNAVQTEAGKHMKELMSLSDQLRPLLQASAFCNVTVLPGWTWCFFAHSVGGVGALTYQWYEGTAILQGQTNMVLPMAKNDPGTYTFYCRITDSEGTAINTNTVTLTVL
jgi:pimeloyl-ACP methyl ester carboxylesterase